MLSRPYTAFMFLPATPPRWDIFCNVIDNFGDIGVCWRLARQLFAEHGVAVRLWVDDLTVFQRICPEIDSCASVQNAQGVEVRAWRNDFSAIVPGDVVIEAFACRLPEPIEEAMASRFPKPVWINLDYLSAEAWVSGCHALPSPHPQRPLTKYFYFPGFSENTGGLLRERDLYARRQDFSTIPEQQLDFWQRLGLPPPPVDALRVSLFAYENQALPDLLSQWAEGPTPVYCLAPMTRTLAEIERFFGTVLQAGDVIRRGNLQLRMLPLVTQADYDRLLWSCDINFVRGEDSFVRAQWAAKPMVWQIYPQQDAAHQVKLEAFLDLYCAKLPPVAAEVVRRLFRSWNGGSADARMAPDLWAQWMNALPAIRAHAENWANSLSEQEDLCSSLVRFCRSKL